MDSLESKQAGMRPVFTPLGIWAFSIGTSIGWGSFIVTCNTYLQKSGILGTVCGLLIGMAANAVYTVVAVCVLIPFIGRTAIGWIVDVTTIGATLIYGMISLGVHLYAKKAGDRTEQHTGIGGMILMAVFLLLLLIPGLLPFHAIETESYILFIAWSVIGLVYFRMLIRKAGTTLCSMSIPMTETVLSMD